MKQLQYPIPCRDNVILIISILDPIVFLQFKSQIFHAWKGFAISNMYTIQNRSDSIDLPHGRLY